MQEDKQPYRRCTLEFADHLLKRCIERCVPPDWVLRNVFPSTWCPHLIDERRTCIFRENGVFWTIILALEECHIFIVTVYKSTYSEIRMYRGVDR